MASEGERRSPGGRAAAALAELLRRFLPRGWVPAPVPVRKVRRPGAAAR